MAQYYKFFNSTDTDRRTYQAGDFADYFGSVLSAGLIHTDEVPGMETFVEGGTLRTYVTPGKAIMQGHLYENTTDEYLEHSLPESSSDRIDRIVLRLDLRNSERNILLHIKEGDPNSNPVAPSLQRDNFIYELSLAQIRIRANTSSLEASDLIDERLDEDLCGLVNSMLTVPTTQFLSEWNTFMDTIRDQSPASQGDLDNLESEFGSHLAESAHKHIHSSGSNDDGEWIRFDDGTQMCWHEINLGSILSFGSGTYSDPYRTSESTWLFPREFAERPKLSTHLMWQGTGATGHHRAVTVSSDTPLVTQVIRVQAYRLSSSGLEIDAIVHLLAIGKWK